MKNSATIALVVLLLLSLGATTHFFLDQKANKKLIADKDATIAIRDGLIAELGKTKKASEAELATAKKSLTDSKSALTRMESEKDFLNVKLTAAESKLSAQSENSKTSAAARQEQIEQIDAHASEMAQKTQELAKAESENSTLSEQLTDQKQQIDQLTEALSLAETDLKPFQELGKTADEIKKALMRRPVSISKPLPPRPARQAGKITEPIPVPAPVPTPEVTPVTPPSSDN